MATETINQKIIKTTKYSDKVNPLSKEDYEALKKSIAERKGIVYPILINQAGDVIDGHHRLQACKELGIEPVFTVKNYASELDEELDVYDMNLARRYMSTYEKAELALKEAPLLAAKAQDNICARKTLSQNKERVHVHETLSQKAGLSKATIYKVDQII